MQISSDHIYPLHSAPAPLSPPGQVTALRPHNDNIVREEARAPSQQRAPISLDKERRGEDKEQEKGDQVQVRKYLDISKIFGHFKNIWTFQKYLNISKIFEHFKNI